MTKKSRNTADILSAIKAKREQPEPSANEKPERRLTGYVSKALDASNTDLEAQADEAKAEAQAARAELAALQDSLKGGETAIKVDPSRVKRSDYADRHPKAFEGHDFKVFVEDIETTGGNIEPGRVRPLRDNPDYDYELAAGHRRHAACLALNLPFFVLCKDMSDQELVAHMRVENRGRKDLSDFELGRQYARLLEGGVFSSQRHMAAGLGEPLRSLQRLLAFGELDPSIVSAFPDPRNIRQHWVAPLVNAFNHDADALKKDIKKIQGDDSLSANDIYQRLVDTEPAHTVVSEDNTVLASRRMIHNRPALILFKGAPEDLLDSLEKLVREYHAAHKTKGQPT